MSKKRKLDELINVNKELADELLIVNKENADELIVTNIGKAKHIEELVIVNVEKAKRVAELVIAKVEKAKLAAELINAKIEKAKRAAELVIANKKLMLANKQEKLAKEKYIELYNFAPSGYFTLNREGKIIESNLYTSEILGKKCSFIKDSWFGIFVSDDTKPIFNHFLEQVFKSQTKRLCDLTLSTDSNLLKYVQLNGVVTKNPKECFVSLVDISERKRAADALRESEEKYRTFFHTNPDATFISTVDEGKIIAINEGYIRMFGYTEAEIIGKKSFEFGIWVNPAERTLLVNKFIRDGKIENYEVLFRTKAGDIINTLLSTSVITLGGVQHAFSIAKDITERKRVKEELKHKMDELIIANKELAFQNEEKEKRVAELTIANKEKEKRADELIIANKELVFQNEEKTKRANELIKAKENAEESDRLKSAFLTNMSHEIRTPLNGILGFAELLKEPNLSIDDQQDYLQTMQISGARMLNTINSIVDISKIESGLTKIDIHETNINEKVEFTYKFFKPEAEIKGLQFLFKNGLPTKESIIKTDNEKVYGILINLVRNAIKFTYDGSIEFGYEKKGEYLEFYVKDTGIGIPKKQHQLIFERFRQGSDSSNRGYEGSGLGLSISKSYVEMLGGRIWVESEEGRGSTFYFTIPYNAVSEEKMEIESAASAEHKEVEIKRLKILIVEDDEISYSLLTRTLQKISKEVLHAITGVEAIEICRNNPDLDLVLMDIRMPNMDGNEATRQIRQFNKDVIIIAQTAYAFAGDSEKAVEAGCNDYISKPINKTLLYELI